MLLMVIYFYYPRVTCLTFTYREASGLWWEDRIRPIVSTVVNLCLNIYLVKRIEMNGVIISTLFCSFFINVPWGTYILFKNYFHMSPRFYFCRIVYYVCITVVAGIITYFTCGFLPSSGWLSLAVKALICLVIPNILLWVVFRNLPEYNYARSLLSRTLGQLNKIRGDKV